MLGYQSASLQVPSGNFNTSYVNAPIHIESPVSSEQEIADRIVYSDPSGGIVRLRDVATVERRYKAPDSFVNYNGSSALIISVEMRSDNDIVAFGKKLDKVLAEFEQDMPESVTLTRITDQPKLVRNSVFSFLSDLADLDVRGDSRDAHALPHPLGADSQLRRAGVHGDRPCGHVPYRNRTEHRDAGGPDCRARNDSRRLHNHHGRLHGRTRQGHVARRRGPVERTRARGTHDHGHHRAEPYVLPGLGLITGYLGDFVTYFPWVVAIALTASLFYAIFVVPSLEVRFIKSAGADQKSPFAKVQNKFFTVLQNAYDSAQDWCFHHPKMTLSAGVGAVVLAVVLFFQLNIQMMPMADRDFFAVEVTLDSNAGLEDTKAVVDSLQTMFLDDERIESVTSFIGNSAPRFTATYTPATPAPNYAQLIVNTKSIEATKSLLPEYEEKYEHYFPEALIRIKQMDYQAATPIEVRVQGADLNTIKPVADTIRAYMQGLRDELKWVHSTVDDYISCVEISLDADEAARLGVNKAMLSLSLAGTLSGQPLASLWEGDKAVPVNLYSSGVTNDMPYDMLGNQQVSTSLPGISVPLRQIADIQPGWEPAQRTRYASEETVIISADMKNGQSQPASMKHIRQFIEGIDLPRRRAHQLRRPHGHQHRGDSGDSDELHLRRGRDVHLPADTFPQDIHRGAHHSAQHALPVRRLPRPLGLRARLQHHRRARTHKPGGHHSPERNNPLRICGGAALPARAAGEGGGRDGGKRRMRPIFLTSCTTGLGVLPMILSGDQLWLPMGVVICFGTLLSVVMITPDHAGFLLADLQKGQASQGGDGMKKMMFSGACRSYDMPCRLPRRKSGSRWTSAGRWPCRTTAPPVGAAPDLKAAEYQKQEAFAEYFPESQRDGFRFLGVQPAARDRMKDIFGNNDFSNNLQNLIESYAPMYGISPSYSTLNRGYLAGISVMQPLFAGGRIVNGNRLAGIGVEAARLQQSMQTRSTADEIEGYWWQIVSLQDKQELLAGSMELVDTLYRDVSAAYEAGLVTEDELLQVKLARNELLSGEVQLRNGLRLAKMNLLNSIGMDYTVISANAGEDRPYIDSVVLEAGQDAPLPAGQLLYRRGEHRRLYGGDPAAGTPGGGRRPAEEDGPRRGSAPGCGGRHLRLLRLHRPRRLQRTCLRHGADPHIRLGQDLRAAETASDPGRQSRGAA